MRNKSLMVVIVILVVGALGGTLAFTFEDAAAAPVQQGQGPGGADEDAPEGPLQGIIDRDAIQQAVAGALGLTGDELQAARADGIRLPELAEQQGVELETVRAAVAAAKAEMVQQALDEGLITEAQADWILSQDGGPRRWARPGGPLARLLRNVVDPELMQQAVADALGLSVEEFHDAREDGMRLPELAEQQGVELEAVRSAAEAAKAEMVQQAVDEGLITEAQADWILSHEGALRERFRCEGRGRFGQGVAPQSGLSPAPPAGVDA